jgi:uncharacterized membrane protein HdeD (DUF308 family)
MGLSVFLAKFFGIYFLIIAAIWLLRKRELEAEMERMTTNSSLVVFTGILQLLIGLAIAIAHPVAELSWRGLITLLGYFALIQGIIRIAFPEEVKQAMSKMIRKGGYVIPIVLIILGIFLTYNGIINTPRFGSLGL